jgi:glycosyltransferase involved in cell wall biosynthesis
MIRVLHITGSMNRGGIETFIMNVYRNIDRDKIQFDFLLSTDKKCDYTDEIQELGGKIFNITPRREGILKNRKDLNNFFSRHLEYQIVHQHVSSLSYITPLKVAKRNKIPVRIVHGHSTQEGGHPLNKYLHKLNQAFIKKVATDYFACSKLGAKWLYSQKQYANHEYEIVNNGIDVDSFLYTERLRKDVREEFNLDDKFVIGHIGRFSYPKNHFFIMDVFSEIHSRNPNSTLFLVGDGEQKNNVIAKIEELGLESNVIMTGVRSDIPNILNAMDAFLLPSRYEGLGIVLIEAQAAGLKCFASAEVVPDEVNVTGQVEFIDLSKSPSEWAEAILKNKQYERYNNIDKIKSAGYDIKVVAENLQNFYLNSIESRNLNK